METRSVRFRTEHRTQNVLRWIFAGIIGLALVLLILFGWFSPVYVADESMVPTLEKGDTVFYDRLYKHFYDLKRGDMVAFRDAEGKLLIKRVVALSGESIEAKDGILIIDGRYGLDEHRYTPTAPLDISRTRVPEGKVFVLSDDRNFGEDSRNRGIGCLDTESILGVVRVRIRKFTIFTQEP